MNELLMIIYSSLYPNEGLPTNTWTVSYDKLMVRAPEKVLDQLVTLRGI